MFRLLLILCTLSYLQWVTPFIERYTHEIQTWDNHAYPVGQKMRDDKIVTISGSYINIPQKQDSLSTTIVYHENQGYEVIWLSEEDTLWHIAMPNSYELILGKSRSEMEDELEQELLNTNPIQEFYSYPKALDSASLILSAIDPTSLNCQLSINQSLYGLHHKNYSVDLKNWLSYCHTNNLDVSIGIEEQTDAEWKILVIARSKELGYEHLISALVPIHALHGDSAVIPVNLTAFIPTHNLAK